MSEETINDDEVPLVKEEPEEKSETQKNNPAESLRILEALIFASDEFLTAARLKVILPGNPGSREISTMVGKINRQLQKERHPFEIVEIGGGYQFKTVAYYHPWVRQIFQEKAAKRLSIQALECLSIIAYRQPLSKAEIEAIRGVISDGAMKTLLEKRLITITGRSEKPGRPLLYGTTADFLRYFGLNRITDLPNIEEFEAMVRSKIENLPIEELASAQARALAQSESPVSDEAAAGAVFDTESTAVEELALDAAGNRRFSDEIDVAEEARAEEIIPSTASAPAAEPAGKAVTSETGDGWAWLNGKSELISESEGVVGAEKPCKIAAEDAGPEIIQEVIAGDESGIVVSEGKTEEIEVERPGEKLKDEG